MNDRLYLNSLFDIYQELLTEHEQLIFKDYYQDDLLPESYDPDTDISDQYDETDTPDVNKTKKRVISYCRQ